MQPPAPRPTPGPRPLLLLAGFTLAFFQLGCCAPAPASLAATPQARAALDPSEPFDHEHRLLDELLAAHAGELGVDYDGLAEDPRLDAYLARLQATTEGQRAAWTRDERFAFWINAYSAHVLALVARERPEGGIRDLGSLLRPVWDRELVPLGPPGPDGAATLLSLRTIEDDILRAEFQDARVHAAINCGSTSCPPLLGAYGASALDAQLEGAMTSFLRDASRNRIDPETGEVELSEVFDWFADDFEREAGSVRAYVARYAGASGGAWLEEAPLDFRAYDWSLNQAPALGMPAAEPPPGVSEQVEVE